MKLHNYEKVPEFEDIGDNIWRIKIPQPFYEDNNVYFIDAGEPTLIDGGYVQNLGILQRALKKIGYSLSKIQHIFYTHDHIDHISTSLVLRYYSKAKHYAMVGLANEVGDYRDHMEKFQMAERRLFYKAHFDYEKRKHLSAKLKSGYHGFIDGANNQKKVDPVLKIDVELREGDVVTIGERELGFLYTPGHNKWHLTPYLVGEGIYFTGDLVLRNVSAVYGEVDGNLQDYQNSLARLLNLPIRRLLPAHFNEPEKPQRAIKVLARTISILERGVTNRLKEDYFDLRQLAIRAMGESVEEAAYFPIALAVMHAIILKHKANGNIEIKEVDPPYEHYRWKE